MHAEFHQKIAQENQMLMHGIASFNESLAELYSRLARWNGQGTTIRDVILPIAQRMSISGISAGSGDFANFDGSIAAARLVLYYQSLPEPIKSAIGECSGHGNNPKIITIVHNIVARECIETAAMQLESALDNPLNDAVLNTTPYMSDEEKMALSRPYVGIKKHEQLIDFDGIPKTITLPSALSASFYQQMNIDHIDDLVGLLTSFPPSEYYELFSQVPLNTFNFTEVMNYIVDALNVEQRGALVKALMTQNVRERLHLSASSLLFTFMHSGDQVAIAQFLDDLTILERLYLLNEKDAQGNTALHLLVFSGAALKAFIELYPARSRTRMKALGIRDHDGATVLHLAGDDHLALKVMIDFHLKYTHGYHPILEAIMLGDNKGRTVLHYAAKNIQSLDMLLKFFRNGDDEEEDDDSVANALSTKDLKGNTVLHYASKNMAALGHLLKFFSNPSDIIELLRQKNHKGDMVLSAKSVNLPELDNIFKHLIALEVRHPTLVSFLTTLIDSQTSLLDFLEISAEGRLILSRLYETYPQLCPFLSRDTWFNHATHTHYLQEDAAKGYSSQEESLVPQDDDTYRFFQSIRNAIEDRAVVEADPSPVSLEAMPGLH